MKVDNRNTHHPSPITRHTSGETVIRVDSVSKKFSRTIKHVMAYGAMDITRDFFGIRTDTSRLRSGEFWAVEDVSFELKRGETLGIIGQNGSGKSTVLKMLNGIYMPDMGRISIRGRVAALIEVGAGFHPMLTGRENIYINGQILGMAKREIDKKFDSIVDFADIGDFLDSPVKHYSSGMYVRLGFAVAIHCEPEILLVDEVLAVGDARFQRKSINAISEMRKKGVSFIIVSHNMRNIESMCSMVLLLRQGRRIMLDKPGVVVPSYDIIQKDVPPAADLQDDSISGNLKRVIKWAGYGTDEILVRSINLRDGRGRAKIDFLSNEKCVIEAELDVNISVRRAFLWISFIYVTEFDDDSNIVCMGTRHVLGLKKGKTALRVSFDSLLLTTGRYKMTFHIFDETFTQPYTSAIYGYFNVRQHQGIPTLLRVGSSTPLCWQDTDIEIN